MTDVKYNTSIHFDLPKFDLTDKVVIITGASGGLGYEAALHLARGSPSRLILANRTASTGQAAAEKIASIINEEKGSASRLKVENWQLDLADFGSVNSFAERVEKELDRLDIFLANAGVAKANKELTEDGFEPSVQTNNISTTYLSHRFLPLLKRTAKSHPSAGFKPHLTLVSSGLYATIDSLPNEDGKGIIQTLSDREDLNEEVDPAKQKTPGLYPQTKVINVLDATSLAKIAGDEVICNSVDPGLCVTNLARDVSEERKQQLRQMFEKFGTTAEIGSKNLVYAVVTDTPSGAYVSKCKVEEKRGLAGSAQAEGVAGQIWDEYQLIWRKHGLI